MPARGAQAEPLDEVLAETRQEEQAETAGAPEPDILGHARHFTERGGGFDTPLTERRVQVREPEEVILGGRPAAQKWTFPVTERRNVRLRSGAHRPQDVRVMRAEYAYEMNVSVWIPVYIETEETGPYAPSVISYGYYRIYRSWLWSSSPSGAGARNGYARQAAALVKRLDERPPLTDEALADIYARCEMVEGRLSNYAPGRGEATGGAGEGAGEAGPPESQSGDIAPDMHGAARESA
jgi:hypothetical protein